MDTITGVFVKSTKEILYSRSKHDYRLSKDGTVAIDGGRDYPKITGNQENNEYIIIKINKSVLLDQILDYDYAYGNDENAIIMFSGGYHGRFIINEYSKLDFYEKLIINWEDIIPYI